MKSSTRVLITIAVVVGFSLATWSAGIFRVQAHCPKGYNEVSVDYRTAHTECREFLK